MAITPDGPAPYAPAKPVIQIVETFRQRDLPTPVTTGVIERLGVTGPLAPRVMKALRLYELIDGKGNPTEQFLELAKASEDDYRERFGAMLRAAYADVFKYVDPAEAPIERVRDQFRHYTPHGQQERMLSLFLALCEYARIIEKAPTKIPRTGAAPKLDSAARSGTRSAKRQAGTRSGANGSNGGAVERNPPPPPPPPPSTDRPDIIEALVAKLPKKNETWTAAEFEWWIRMMQLAAPAEYGFQPKVPDG